MNILRKTLALLLASAVLTFTLPALAASGTKYVSFQFPAIISPVGGVVTLDVPFTNDSTPPGVSTINSLQVGITGENGGCIAALGFTDRSSTPTFSPSTGCATAVTLTNFTGIRRGETAMLRVTLNGVSDATCTLIEWNATANTGNSLNGDTFLPSPTNPSQFNSRANCSGILSCVDGSVPVGTTPTFDGSVNGAAEFTPGNFQGFRKSYHTLSAVYGSCPLAYYRTTNTTTGFTGNVTVDGYTLGKNTALISYVVPGDSILLDHTITFGRVWSDTNGLFNPERIRYCKKETASGDGTYDCTGSPATNTNLKIAKGCLSPDTAIASIPLGEPGCVKTWEVTIRTPELGDLCGNASRPTAGSGNQNRACMQVTIDVIEGKDPPWGLTDE